MNSNTPFKLTNNLRLLIIALAIASFLGWQRCWQALSGWNWMLEIGLTRLNLIYFLISGLAWGLGCLAAVISLLIHYPKAGLITRLVCLTLAVLFWLDRLIMVRSSTANENTPFMLSMTCFGLAWVWISLRKWY